MLFIKVNPIRNPFVKKGATLAARGLLNIEQKISLWPFFVAAFRQNSTEGKHVKRNGTLNQNKLTYTNIAK